MNNERFIRAATLLCSTTLLASCAAFRTADNSLATAAQQVATEDMTLAGSSINVPKAKITPKGDFLIGGKPVALTPQQRNEVLQYRAQYVKIAEQDIAIARQGVADGRRALVPIVFEMMIGESDSKVESHMNARLATVYRESFQLCNRLSGLMVAQQRLAVGLRAFEPYATLTARKIKDCRGTALKSLDTSNQ